MNSINIYRTVGFTNSTYMDGSPEVGWIGDFFATREEAEEAGCGVGESWHNGTETREYTIEDHGDEWRVFVDGEFGTSKLHDEAVEAAIELGLATENGLFVNA
jgi:hypothetical protein